MEGVMIKVKAYLKKGAIDLTAFSNVSNFTVKNDLNGCSYFMADTNQIFSKEAKKRISKFIFEEKINSSLVKIEAGSYYHGSAVATIDLVKSKPNLLIVKIESRSLRSLKELIAQMASGVAVPCDQKDKVKILEGKFESARNKILDLEGEVLKFKPLEEKLDRVRSFIDGFATNWFTKSLFGEFIKGTKDILDGDTAKKPVLHLVPKEEKKVTSEAQEEEALLAVG